LVALCPAAASCLLAVSIGGIQSNHARATAVAATYLGLACHLILRNSRTAAESDPGLVGNLLVERLAGAVVHQVGMLWHFVSL
jgi:1-aminocyclopropane-1-carboxylate deaminase/D-cysteine desulfhydrase-like pyridoxal-dependent ACC family enzyme